MDGWNKKKNKKNMKDEYSKLILIKMWNHDCKSNEKSNVVSEIFSNLNNMKLCIYIITFIDFKFWSLNANREYPCRPESHPSI
jgi:hypothetical protein